MKIQKICNINPAQPSGGMIKKLMRIHHVTIRQLSARMDVPMTRVRQVRDNGPETAGIYMDYREAIVEN